MANSTTFLTIPAARTLGTQIVYIEREIDFALENLAVADTMDVLRLPKGAVLMQSIVTTETANTDTSATLAIATGTSALTIDAADTLPAANAANITALATSSVLTADDTVRLTCGVADLTDAKIVVGMTYIVSDSRL